MSEWYEKNSLVKCAISNMWSIGVGAGVICMFTLLRRLGIIYQLIHKVDPKSSRHGGELVAEVLKAHGVKHVFTLVGGHISPILVGCEKLGLNVIDTRHEVTAVFAADAVARLSGTVGVAVVTAGPGLTNTITAVKNAQMAESPILVMGGAAATLLKGRGALQDIEQLALFKPLCKFCTSIKRVADIIPVLRKALQEAQSNTPGPVFVEFPIDVLYPYHTVLKEAVGAKQSGSIFSKVINWYLTNHVNNLFAGAWEQRDTSPLAVNCPVLSIHQVMKSAEILENAKKPVFVIGSQALLPPANPDKLREALEEAGFPCFLGGMARGLLGRNSPLHIRQKRGEALKEADVIILAGTVCDFRMSYGRVLNKKAKIIAVNRSKEQLLKNSGLFWKPTVAIQGDVATFLMTLFDGLEPSDKQMDAAWLQKLQDKDRAKEESNRKMAESEVDQHVNPLKVLHHLEQVMGDNAIIVADGGDFVGSAAYILRPRGPLQWLDPGPFGTLGVGGGFALGAKLVRPDSEVWIVYGDGSLGYSVAEFDTFTRHKTPVIAVVGNDACWSQIAREQIPMLGSNVACQLAFSEYEVVAKGYGGQGFRIDSANEDQIVNVLKKAKQTATDGDPALVNCLIGKSSFREGSISV